jgi:AbrB family looped-hinge helix DNA binding protein
MNVVMGKAGRVVIPIAVREQLALSEGTPLEVVVRDNIIELHDRRRKIDGILNAFSQRLKADCGSLSSALIEERRSEAAREAT